MMDSADPLNGWDLVEVSATSAGPASNDLYGQLFNHLKSVFTSFCYRLATCNLEFQLLNVNAEDLGLHPSDIEEGTFARVEASNVGDVQYLGVARTVEHLGRFLQWPKNNPHATLITLFMTAVKERTSKEKEDVKEKRGEMLRLMQYVPFTAIEMDSTYMYSSRAMMRITAHGHVRDVDKSFNR